MQFVDLELDFEMNENQFDLFYFYDQHEFEKQKLQKL